MKAAVLKGAKELAIEEVPTPKAEAGEVIVKMKYVGICGSDLHLYQFGMMPPGTIMGHECSGVVHEIGDGVEGWKVGDRVAIFAGIPCGNCYACQQGRSNVCKNAFGIGFGAMPGGYAEYLKVFANMLVRVPDEVSLEDASLLDPYSISYRAAKLSGIQAGDVALVMGAGPIGLTSILQLRIAGAKAVVATERMKARAALARDFGADRVLDPSDDVHGALKELTDGDGPKFVFECAGAPDTLQEAAALVRRAGTVALVGVCMDSSTVQPFLWVIKEINIQTSFGYQRDEFEGSLAQIQDGTLKTQGFVTGQVSLEELPQTFARLNAPNEEVKVLVEFPD